MASNFRKESQVISFIITDILGCKQKFKYCHKLCRNVGGPESYTHAADYLDLNLTACLIFSHLYPVYKISEYYKRLNIFKPEMGLTFSLSIVHRTFLFENVLHRNYITAMTKEKVILSCDLEATLKGFSGRHSSPAPQL